MGKKTGIDVMIVDDHPLVRDGLREIINREGDMTVKAEASCCEEAIRALSGKNISVAIVDITLKNSENGLDLVKAIGIRYPSVHCLVLSMHDENVYAERALRAGALGYIMKHEAGKNVVESIRLVASGELCVSAAVSKRIMSAYLRGGNVVDDPVSTLSDRELEVFKLIGRGLKTSDIAKALRLSVSTVETYRANIKDKLGLSSSAQLARVAVESALSGAL
jgi:DNA-binding NarL/FixJ family response regulator